MKKLILILVLFLAGCVCISKKEYKELLEASQSIIILPSVYPTQAELRQEAREIDRDAREIERQGIERLNDK